MAEKYTCDWYNDEKTIILVESTDADWTWQDMQEAVEEQVTLTETVEHPVHIIFHFMVRPNIPRSGAFQNLPRLMEYRAKNEDLGVFVGFNMLLGTLLKAVGKVYGLRNLVDTYRFVDTMEEALAEIANYEQAKESNRLAN